MNKKEEKAKIQNYDKINTAKSITKKNEELQKTITKIQAYTKIEVFVKQELEDLLSKNDKITKKNALVITSQAKAYQKILNYIKMCKTD